VTTPEATPGSAIPEVPTGIDQVVLPADLSPSALADRLAMLPEEIAGLPRREVTSGADSATAIYLAGEETGRPSFGMIVVLIVPARDDADAMVAELQRARWGDTKDHTITASGVGDATTPAFREFWRTFPPGLFALPNQPIHFLIFARAGIGYALMVIATSPAIRAAMAEALGDTLYE
jgi:hypothetical protein